METIKSFWVDSLIKVQILSCKAALNDTWGLFQIFINKCRCLNQPIYIPFHCFLVLWWLTSSHQSDQVVFGLPAVELSCGATVRPRTSKPPALRTFILCILWMPKQSHFGNIHIPTVVSSGDDARADTCRGNNHLYRFLSQQPHSALRSKHRWWRCLSRVAHCD